MEVTCWHCHAVFNPEAAGNRCPNCGHHPEAWQAKVRFAVVDFIGPAFLVGLALYHFNEDAVFSTLFIIGSLVWMGFILYEDVSDWTPATDVPLGKPPIPDTWKRLVSIQESRRLGFDSVSEARTRKQLSVPLRASGLTGAEQLLVAALTCALIAYAAVRRNQLGSFLAHTKIPVTFVTYIVVIGGLVAYAVRRTRSDEQILSDGVLAPGVLTGWYDKSYYSRAGYHSYIRIRYQFWTESGQKFEGSGTLRSGTSMDSLSINQEPLKVFYLPQNPGKSVALCCTVSGASLD